MPAPRSSTGRRASFASPRRVRRLGSAAAILGIAAVGSGCIATRPFVLVVEDVARQRTLHRASVAPGSRFVLSYVHSSEHVPVRGTFVVEPDGALLVKETAFAGFGPGLPQPKAGDAWRLEDGMIVVPAAGERFLELRVRVAPFTGHHLRTPSGEDIDLSAAMRDGGSVRIHVAPQGR